MSGLTMEQARADAIGHAIAHDRHMAMGLQRNDDTGEDEFGFCPLSAIGPAFVHLPLERYEAGTGRIVVLNVFQVPDPRIVAAPVPAPEFECKDCGSSHISGLPTSVEWDVEHGRWHVPATADVEELQCCLCQSDNIKPGAAL